MESFFQVAYVEGGTGTSVPFCSQILICANCLLFVLNLAIFGVET